MSAAGVIVLIVFLLLVAAGIGWVVFTRMRASRLGLPPPSLSSYIPFRKPQAAPYGPPHPAPGGIQGWINERIRQFKQRNQRTASGAYEGSSGAPRGRAGFGPLDPDEAWDTRVGHEADTYGPGGYYEEQELGLHPAQQPHAGGLGPGPYGDTAYSGSSYAMNLAASPGAVPAGYGGHHEEERGRPRSRSPGLLAGGSGAGAAEGRNPFDDDAAEASNMSLRGVSPRPIETARKGSGNKDESPTERRSIFRESV